MQAAFEDVLRLRSGALTRQTILAASALFDRPFLLVSDFCLDETAINQPDQILDDENSDADTEYGNMISQVEKSLCQAKI